MELKAAEGKGRVEETVSVHRQIYEQTAAIGRPELVAKIMQVAREHDQRRARLAGESPSPNTRAAATAATVAALDAAAELDREIGATLGPGIERTRAALMEPPSVADPDRRLRLQGIWSALQAKGDLLDPVLVRAAWSGFSEELRDALLTSPPRIAEGRNGTGSFLVVEDLVDPELREQEMRARRPDLASQLDALERQRDALRALVTELRRAVEGKHR